MLGNLGATEILLIVAVISLLFGAKRIPEIAKGIGKGIHDFKKEIKSVEEITKWYFLRRREKWKKIFLFYCLF